MPPFDADALLPLGDTVDVRPAHDFRIGHFESAINCPMGSLADSLHLLPARDAPLWVYGADADVGRALALLRERGYNRVAAHPALTSFASPREHVRSVWTSGEERVRLWRPTAFLAEAWPKLRDALAERTDEPWQVLDLACGSGRDSVWLALAGCSVLGVDHLPDAIALAESRTARAARALAAASPPPGVDPATPEWLVADLTESVPLRSEAFDLVLVMRFLHRPLLKWLPRLLRPGGFLLYCTFTRDQARRGRPTQPEYLLKPGELRKAAERGGLHVRSYDEVSPEDGPALASLWAERPPSAH